MNCFVGVARLQATGETDAALARIQNDLFDLGADLCRPDMEQDAKAEYPPLRMIAAQVDRLEAEIDVMNADSEPLRSFVLPGGTRWRRICMSAAPLRAAPNGWPSNWPPGSM